MATVSEAAERLEKTLVGGDRVFRALRTGEITPISERDELHHYSSGHYRLYMLKKLAELQEAVAFAQQVIIEMPEGSLPRIKADKPVWRAN